MISRDQVLLEIQRTARENDGRPLGVRRFERETGITPYEWGRYWARFGDAQKEAGLIPNQLQGPHADQYVFEKLIELIRKLKKFPTYREIEAARGRDASLPTKDVFMRRGTKEQLASKVVEYCNSKAEFSDVVELCRPLIQKSHGNLRCNEGVSNAGEVYLAKSGKFYKIGKSMDVMRRGKELRIQLAEKLELIHVIKTDDPNGVEAYWHRRFEAKRMRGEWFDLHPATSKFLDGGGKFIDVDWIDERPTLIR